MSLDAPAATVIIATFNRRTLLRRALASLAAQWFRDFEVIVVNDGGHDVRDVVAAEPAANARLVDLPVNVGLSGAQNAGLAEARGRFVCYLNDDDVYLPHHLAAVAAELARLGPGHAVYTYAVQVLEDEAGQVLGRTIIGAQEFDPGLFQVTNLFPAMCAAVPTDVLRAVGGSNTAFDVLDDWDLWLRVASVLQWSHLAVPTAEYRMRQGHDNSTTREFFRFHAALERIYERHPVPAGPVAEARAQMRAGSQGRAEAYVFDFSAVVLVGVDDDRAEVLRTLLSVQVALASTAYEVLLLLPHFAGWESFAEALGGDVGVYAVGPEAGAEVEAFARRKAAGRVALLVAAGDVVDDLDLDALRGPNGTVVRVGHHPTAIHQPA